MLFTSFHALFERPKAYVTRADKAIKGHLDNCLNVEHLFSINNLILNDVNTLEFRLNLARQNTRIIDESNNWNFLLFKEAYHFKKSAQFLIMVSRRLGKCNSFECNLALIYIQIMFQSFSFTLICF